MAVSSYVVRVNRVNRRSNIVDRAESYTEICLDTTVVVVLREIDLCFLFAFCKCQCAACTRTASNKEMDTRLKSHMRFVHHPIGEVSSRGSSRNNNSGDTITRRSVQQARTCTVRNSSMDNFTNDTSLFLSSLRFTFTVYVLCFVVGSGLHHVDPQSTN